MIKLWYSVRTSIYTIMCITMLMVIVHYRRLEKEHTIMKESLSGMGGGFPKISTEKKDNNYIIEWWIRQHGLLLYHWKMQELAYPVINPSNTYVRSEKGWRYIMGVQEEHQGVDLVSKYDLRVKAMHKGKIIAGVNKYYGKYIIIKDGVYITKYFHLSKLYVEDGQTVGKGDIIGVMGDTGNSYGCHLHIEIWFDGENVNPFTTTTYNKRVEM